MKSSLEKRIILFAFTILSLTIFASTVVEIVAIRKDYIAEMLLRSRSLGNSLRSSIEKVLALGISISDIQGLSEKCQELIAPDPDMSFCIISDKSGTTLYSSSKPTSASLPLSSEIPAALDVGNHRLPSEKHVTPHGIYYDTATPVLSFDGSVVANIHIGFPQQSVDRKIHPIILRSVIVFISFFTISFALVVVFVKKSIVTPIKGLLGGVVLISRGEYKNVIPPLPVLELSDLADNINTMASSLDARDQELRRNYDDLARTHADLHNSYQQLEILSLELEKSEELFRKILEESGDAILILDRSEQVMISNKRASELFGISGQEIATQHISSLLLAIHAENIPQLLKNIRKAYDEPSESSELLFTNRNLQQRTGQLDISRIALGDKALLQLIIRDITRERDILNNLEQSAAGLARLNRMKDSFLGLASHELKTPLTVILGYSELLQNDIQEQLPETAREMIQNISNAANRLDGIVKDMIDVSMLDHKQLTIKHSAQDINKILEATVHELRFFVALRKQEIITDYAQDLPLFMGDRTRLSQMFSNIIGNAIKFTPDGGKITIRTKATKLLSSNSTEEFQGINSMLVGKEYQNAIEISVTDNGIGINPEDQTKIFDKFFEAGNIQEHSTGKVAFNSRGVGLGLSIAKGVAEVHGGQIWVESPGYNPVTFPGSTFFIVLPLETSHENEC